MLAFEMYIKFIYIKWVGFGRGREVERYENNFFYSISWKVTICLLCSFCTPPQVSKHFKDVASLKV